MTRQNHLASAIPCTFLEGPYKRMANYDYSTNKPHKKIKLGSM